MGNLRFGLRYCNQIGGKKLRKLTLITSIKLCNLSWLAKFVKLRSITLRNPPHDICNWIPKQIKYIDLQNGPSCDDWTPYIHLKTLKLSQYDIKKLLVPPSLREIRLHKCHFLADITSISKCDKLEKLVIFESLALSNVTSLGECRSLKFLSLQKCSHIINVPKIPTLKFIDLSSCTKLISFQGWDGLKDVKLRYCSRLIKLDGLSTCKALDLHGCCSIDASIIIKKFPTIKFYNLDGIESVKWGYVYQFESEFNYS